MATQEDIDAAVSQINTTLADLQNQTSQLGTDVAAIKTEIGNLPANVDTTALNAAVQQLATTQANLDVAVGSVGNLAPQAPATPAAPPADQPPANQ